ncbi:hypothetical protein DU19_0325 [Chlamydia muridarum]|uniref:Uncharacterized protein n=1 Tax=Chlamydia muridarum (strain MoPn / Nigg) TaxID=243161 RepID=Q9PL21_CHLMU|nr:hypothetical protein TC_0287 [Chlamydia muridarum str. Nigg]KDU80108.1 hypothetical protein DU17_0327 [Chlamydia muridarum]KDU82765.1 hypothetical protein DU19_0325 [Chlamydia muridarum]KDU83245.1 hypothetical protein DU20_0325 [Chlamydia muridarum]KDU84675.1 hypothetical protein DU21_0327 [Chlamydia muridarum]
MEVERFELSSLVNSPLTSTCLVSRIFYVISPQLETSIETNDSH